MDHMLKMQTNVKAYKWVKLKNGCASDWWVWKNKNTDKERKIDIDPHRYSGHTDKVVCP